MSISIENSLPKLLLLYSTFFCGGESGRLGCNVRTTFDDEYDDSCRVLIVPVTFQINTNITTTNPKYYINIVQFHSFNTHRSTWNHIISFKKWRKTTNYYNFGYMQMQRYLSVCHLAAAIYRRCVFIKVTICSDMSHFAMKFTRLICFLHSYAQYMDLIRQGFSL